MAIQVPILDGPAHANDGIWARCRPPRHRNPVPAPGDRVGYRHNPGGPVSQAVVERVDTSNQADFNVWRFVVDEHEQPVIVDGRAVMELTDDPWPDVWLYTDFGRVVTREARLPGSAGWLPAKGV